MDDESTTLDDDEIGSTGGTEGDFTPVGTDSDGDDPGSTGQDDGGPEDADGGDDSDEA